MATAISIPQGVAAVDKVASDPPPGKCKVTNIYVDPDTGKLVIKYDDAPT